MGPRFASLILFLHLLILLVFQSSGVARVLDNEKLSEISDGDHKDTKLLPPNTVNVFQENEKSSNVKVYDVKQHIMDNQFRIYDKKDDALDNQFWVYDKKNDYLDKQASMYGTKDAVGNQAWIYDGKSGGVDKQLWIYRGTNDAVDNQAWIYDRKYDGLAKQLQIYNGVNDAVDNQAWIYDRKSADNQAWIYDKHNDDNQEIYDGTNDAVDKQVWIHDRKSADNQAWIYDKHNGYNQEVYDGIDDAVDKQAWIYDRKNDRVDNQAWIYDKHNGDNQEITGTGHTSSHLDHMDPKGHTSSRLDHLDQTLLNFFRLKDLKLGKTMFTKFPKTDPLSSLVLLPKAKADKIPFSSKEFPKHLQFFPFSEESPQAKAMEDTLRKCEAKPIKGETKFCATSFESMLNFARETFGLQKNVNVLSTVHLTRSTAEVQKYTIDKAPVRISAPKMVACHTMPYPYTVFYCHYQESESRVYKVSLDGENGDRVEAIAACHMDTSHWSPDHISFRVLGIEPGTSPVCHFFAVNHLVLVPSASI